MSSNRLLLLITVGLSCSIGSSQVTPTTPGELIRFLTYQAGRPADALPPQVSSPSRDLKNYRTNQATAATIAAFGQGAIPDLLVAYDSVARAGEGSPYARNAGWWMLAYSRIEGRGAYPRLRALVGPQHLRFLVSSADRAIALALGLTSYVSGFQDGTPFERAFDRFRVSEPRDAMDSFIRGVEMHERGLVEAGLGPNAKKAFHASAGSAAWRSAGEAIAMRQLSGSAVGYRLKLADRLGEPEETLQDSNRPDRFESWYQPQVGEIETVFVDQDGGACGSHRIRFLREAFPPLSSLVVKYLIDNGDIKELIELVKACALITIQAPNPK